MDIQVDNRKMSRYGLECTVKNQSDRIINMKDIIKRLEDTLTQNYQQSLVDAEKTPEKKGYAQGLKQALNIVDSMKKELGISGPPHISSNQTKESGVPKLHRLSAEQVCALNLHTPDQEKERIDTTNELIEAAFRFENELLATLGDDNTVPIEAYETLDAQKLTHIIVTATEKIVQLQQGNYT